MQKNSSVEPWTWLAPLSALHLTTVVPRIVIQVVGTFEPRVRYDQHVLVGAKTPAGGQ
jgi:hypothetical protein